MGLVPNLGFVTDAFSHDVTLREWAAATTDDDGNRVRGAPTTRPISAHCFPTPGDVLRNLPSGHESGKTITIRTTEVLRVSDPATGVPSPAVVWNGREYELSMEGQRTAAAGELSQHEYFAKLVRRTSEVP